MQEKVISRVGGKAEIPLDVRIISATHRDLEKMIVDGKFREDLFFRLSAATIRVPALRDRLEDLKQLASYFAAMHAKELEIDVPDIPRQAMERLTQHHWPGNARELEDIIWRALIESRRRTISNNLINDLLNPALGTHNSMTSLMGDATLGFEAHIREVLLQSSLGDLQEGGALPFLTEELERILYQQALVLSRGNQTSMAKWIGVSRLTIREKLYKYKLYPKRAKRA
jgi:DNA-binding NtrC family response regulator